MKLYCCALILILALTMCRAAKPLSFTFPTGFKQVSTDWTDCSSDSDVQQKMAVLLGGKSFDDVIEQSKKNPTHVTCSANDPVMGKSINLTLYLTDDEPVKKKPNKQRLEMKVSLNPNPKQLHATSGSQYIYAWWFKLNKNLIAGDKFFHIFQIKAEKTDTNPLVTLSLTKSDGLHLRLTKKEGGTLEPEATLVKNLPSVVGNWIQAFVQIQYSNNGLIVVTLKDQAGNVLSNKTLNNNNVWKGVKFYRPKWGLYRHIPGPYKKPGDSQLFSNIQIWNKK